MRSKPDRARMTSDIVSVEIGRTWQGPAEIAMTADNATAPERIWADHLRRDLCASGQVRACEGNDLTAVVGICRTVAQSMLDERIQWRLDPAYILRLCDALTPAPQAEATENYADPDSSARQPEGDTGPSVVCNGCGWAGDEDGLIATLDAEDGEPCRACPDCRTDANLMDVPAQPLAAAAQKAVIDTDDYSAYVLIPYEDGHDPCAGVGTWNGVANYTGQTGFPTKEAAMRYCEDTIRNEAERAIKNALRWIAHPPQPSETITAVIAR